MNNMLDAAKRYLEQANQQIPLHKMTPMEVREMRSKAPKIKLEKSVPLSKVQDKYILVRDGEQIPIRIYTPQGNGPFPIILYFHGGGWVLNDIETCHASCQLIASLSDAIVISVGYRLAPQHKFPTPLYDAYDAFLWTVKNSSIINGKQDQITVMGDSAGGNLATVVALLNKELNGPTIAAQVLLYPVTDLSFSTDSYEEFSVGFGLEKKDMQWFAHYYLNNMKEQVHPLAAPLQAEDLSNLPNACIIVAENDVLRDEGIAYAKRLQQFGNIVELHTAKGLIHSYFTKNEYFGREIEDTVYMIRDFLKHQL
ncbi:alpha/beta hydrolase [Lysinibacillus yapensis]|uniref:Alpha/beta hydrolase n=1 Tax=Ureibacillus yapensis TaxID=2304605 RepID=A0A396SAB5_9BACL|nr:alpha/beta hydrolase [Lysinibacillus yapensis]RHW38271.1 alpha/beta hydrolase [Lysinibacillus yapensis]